MPEAFSGTIEFQVGNGETLAFIDPDALPGPIVLQEGNGNRPPGNYLGGHDQPGRRRSVRKDFVAVGRRQRNHSVGRFVCQGLGRYYAGERTSEIIHYSDTEPVKKQG